MRLLAFYLLFLVVQMTASGQDALNCGCPPMSERDVVEIDDANGQGVGTTVWTCDHIYVLTETVFVNPGDTLVVEPGTVVQGRTGIISDTLTYVLPNGNPSKRVDYVFEQEAGSLVVSPDAVILADGTPDCAITFTYEGDPMDGTSNLGHRGLWGGLILCGHGAINTYDGNDTAEGVEDDSGQNRHLYGTGEDPEKSSGVLRYVSLRHGSTSLGISQFGNGNETNLLQLCAVGSETVIDFVETIASADDGLQIFGGVPDISHIICTFNAEDQWEFDQGWRGRGQHLLAVANPALDLGAHAGDFEGDDYEEFDVTLTFMPYTSPTLYNMTFIGDGDSTAIRLHNGGGVQFHNSLIVNFDLGIDFEDDDPCDAWELYLFGETMIRNNRFHNIGDSTGMSEIIDYNAMVWNGMEYVEGGVFNGQEVMEEFLSENNNYAADPGMDALFGTDGFFITDTIWPIPTTSEMLVDDGSFLPPFDGWFDLTYHIGAFDPAEGNWAMGWTYADALGLFGEGDGNPTTPGTHPGCIYDFACNYNPEADLDDGSCEITSCAGCTLPCAENYEPEAMYDDGSCIPCDDSGGGCPGDLDGNNMVTVQDMLLFLGLFGEVCSN